MQEVLTWQRCNYRASSEDVRELARKPGPRCLQTIFDEYQYKLVGGLDKMRAVSDEKSDSEEEDPEALQEFLQEVGAVFNDNTAAAELPSHEEASCQSGLDPVDVSSLTGATRDDALLCAQFSVSLSINRSYHLFTLAEERIVTFQKGAADPDNELR